MIGKAIKVMRNENNMKQTDLIKMLNIGQSTLSDYENEKISIDFETLEKIAKLCDYTIYFKNNKTGEEFETKDLVRKDI